MYRHVPVITSDFAEHVDTLQEFCKYTVIEKTCAAMPVGLVTTTGHRNRVSKIHVCRKSW
eukprot:3402074-Amphidinium_carterae.1